MEDFRFGRAWSLGYALVTRKPLYHAILLIGLGILAPMALQLGMAGTLAGTPNPALLGANGVGAGPAYGAALLAAVALGYVLQTAGYFGSLRVGLGREASLGPALLFGLPTGVMAVAILAGAIAIGAVTFAQMMAQPGLALLLGILAAAPVIVASAVFYTLMSAVMAVGVVTVLLLMMMIGAATGNIGMAATMVGGSGAIAVMLIALGLVWLWLTARLSCTAAIMAERKSLNLVAAVRESWRLTWEEQWGILRYLALLGFGLLAVFLAVMIVVGLGAAAALQFNPAPQQGTAILFAIGLIVGIPIAYLGVMVPGGIFRSLHTATDDAEIFA
ncbi:MAG: hypothetical protein E6G92_00725 [Alphaproteobacteria bacterium]|nr:MAG: hypothetical protein E6G92_00725 [Alphaproteobacteria bacterium]